jgi:hypothetical protein
VPIGILGVFEVDGVIAEVAAFHDQRQLGECIGHLLAAHG